MKRSLYDSEYERIRRAAGLGRQEFAEFDEVDQVAPVDLERVQRAHDDFKKRMAELNAAETAAATKRKEEYEVHSRRWNLRALFGEYHRAGIAPPLVNSDGTPIVSLTMLIRMGWSIGRDIDGHPVMLAPAIDLERSRRSRADYERTEGT